ncbi:thioredoxin-related transmembrane protein 1 [Plakobranchus ocellatus]|uniref:Thioredoxin-related transmembrane protein 1 n=1 Tax=Plakobranchus ocellatus TaxID=259542 RepID=A0AAV3YRI8_9GAST|nr:thioredoxin-related transmembrane protein 1 [Plakobranchus ocellatus]
MNWVVAHPNKQKSPITVTDGNWTNILEGEWMLEFMAPWCPACRSFTEVWAEFATWSYDLDISVGVIDVTENPGLSGRFLVTSLPTLYHVQNGEFRQYTGARKTTDLIAVIDEKKWATIEPVAWYRDPKSFQMGVLGAFFKAAMFIRGVYSTMTDVYGIPEWLCYVIFAILTILIGLLLGLLLVICCDNFFPAKYIPLPPERLAHKPSDDREDDTDIIDDTVDEQKHPSSEEEAKQTPPANPLSDDSDLRKRIPRSDE